MRMTEQVWRGRLFTPEQWHRLLEGGRIVIGPNEYYMNQLVRFWHGTPTWFKAHFLSVQGRQPELQEASEQLMEGSLD